MKTPSDNEPTIAESFFRKLMGEFATGVTVVTVSYGGTVQSSTVQSFSSISLRPQLIMISLSSDGRTQQLIRKANSFTVSILASDQEEVSRVFADPSLSSEERFSRVKWFPGKSGHPIISDCIGYVESRVVATHPSGDHTIFVAEVTGAGYIRHGAKPLIYFESKYFTLQA